MKRMRIALSLGLAALLLIHGSWFFTAMALMVAAMVVTGVSGSWRDWTIWVALLLGFSLFMGLRAWMGPVVETRPRFLYVVGLETLDGHLPLPTLWLQERLESSALNRWGALDALSTVVYVSFFLVPQIVAVYLWRRRRFFQRYVVSALLLYAVSLAIHFILPTAPPWMAAEKGLLPPMDRIVVRVLTTVSASLTAGGYEASANDVAAMPSVHLGLTALGMIALGCQNPRTRVLGWTYTLLMLFSITYLGEHYVVDGLVGVALAWGAWRAAGALGSVAPAIEGGTPA